MNEATRKYIGEACRRWRVQHGYTQDHIAQELHYTQTNISRFENGSNDNMTILLWYIKHGFDPIAEVFGGV